MVTDPDWDVNVVRAYLDDVQQELAAVTALLAPGNRFAVFHLQQAAEKLARAVRLRRGLVCTKDHDLAVLVDGRPGGGEPTPLPDGDPWRERIGEIEWLSRYATSFRYPSSAGNVAKTPTADVLLATRDKIAALLALARSELLGE